MDEVRRMNWKQGGTVIVRLPPDNKGKVVELVGDIGSMDLEMKKDGDEDPKAAQSPAKKADAKTASAEPEAGEESNTNNNKAADTKKGSGVKKIEDMPDAYSLAGDVGEYRIGTDRIRFGPGRMEHRWVQLRGAEPKLEGLSVFLTGFTPFEQTIQIDGNSV